MAANQKGAVDKAQAAKPAEAIEVPKLDPRKTYTVIGTGTSFMPKGAEYVVGGSDAMVIIGAGRATLKA